MHSIQLKKFFLPLVVLLLALAVLFSTISPALAATPEPVKPLPGLGKVTNTELTIMLGKEWAWYDSQLAVIRDAYALDKLFQTMIGKLKNKNRDVTALETAVANFENEILAAETSRAETAKILSANGGFNSFYNVIDRPAAGRTIVDAKTSLKGTHLRLMQAMLNLEHDYHTWRMWFLKKNP